MNHFQSTILAFTLILASLSAHAGTFNTQGDTITIPPANLLFNIENSEFITCLVSNDDSKNNNIPQKSKSATNCSKDNLAIDNNIVTISNYIV